MGSSACAPRKLEKNNARLQAAFFGRKRRTESLACLSSPHVQRKSAVTQLEAMKVIEILLTADGGCPGCIASLFKKFGVAFPEFEYLCSDAWMESWGELGTLKEYG